MRKIYALTVALLVSICSRGQDNCSNATPLCANNTIASTTFGATANVNDPALSCGDFTVNNSVWYTVQAISNGTCNVNVGLINNNPGLEMEVYTGSCGSLVTTGSCNSANGPGGSMNVSFAVSAGSTYFIMVDGSSGNQESFIIQATSATSSILGRPIPGFIPSTFSGCSPLSVLMINTTAVSGGSNITYQWRIDAGVYINATGNDTTIVFNTTGSHTVDLKVCNSECGCASVTQFIDVEDLVGSITPPTSICPNIPVDFAADAQYLPDPPFTPVNIVSWDWDFGDPASGTNTANGQNVQHAFSDSGNFIVTLIVTSADCGIDTSTVTVHVNANPHIDTGPDHYICEFDDDTITATVTNGTSPYTYLWSGVGVFSCDTCATTIVGGLSAGGPYPISIHVDDAGGCFSDTTININVNPKPVLDPGSDQTVCPYSTVPLNAAIVQGTPPFTFSWTPGTGLNDSTLQSPTAIISAPITYCVVAQDSIGCTSDTICVNINLYPPPTINAAPGILCASDPNPTTTLDVTGPAPGSTYSWTLSPAYSRITGSNVDSSSINLSFPTGVATTYDFTCVVTDGVTGCKDTATFTYTVVAGLNMVVNIPPGGCIGIPSTLTASGANTYAWSASPAYPFADSTLSTQSVSPSDTTVFTVTGTVGTCTQVISDTVNVYPRPSITVSNDTTVCPSTPAQIFSNASGGTSPYSYTWSPSIGLSDSTQQNPFATISSTATYCATATDVHGCISDTQCVDMDIYPRPTVSALPSTLCASTPNPQTVFTVSGAGAGSTYSWASSADYSLITSASIDSSSVTISLPQGSTSTYSFSVLVLDGVTGCITVVPQTFTMTSGLNLSVSGPSAFCVGDSATLTVSGATTYAWTASPSYTFIDSTSATQTVAPSVTTVFTIAGSVLGCNAVTYDTLTVNAKPDAVVSSIPDFCGCTTANLSGILSTPGMSYNWTSTAGNSIINSNVVNATSAICTSDSFVLVVTDPSTGCADTASVNANRIPPPAAFAIPNPDMICDATTTTILLDGTGSDTTTGTTYLWTSNNLAALFADSSAIVTTATINTATIFYLTVTDSLGCDSTYSDTVSIYPTPSIFANPFLCTSDPVLQATITISGASPGSTYVWDTIPACVTPSSTNASSQVFDFATCGPGAYNFSILVTDSVSGCVKRLSQTITVVTGVTLTVSPDAVICEGDSTSLTVSGANSFLWNPGGDTTASVNVTGLTAGSYSYIVTGTIGSCVSSDTINVTVNPSPQTTPIIGPLVVCDSAVGQTYDVTPLAGNYTWTITNGTITSGLGTGSITVNWDSAGTGTLTVVDSNSFGCYGVVQTVSVTINPIPITSPVNGPDSVCENSLATYFVNPNAGCTYAWSVINGTIIGSSTDNVVIIQWFSAGTGSVQVFETNAVGCTGSPVMLTVNIFPVPLMPAINGSTTVCYGDTTQIYSTPTIAGVTYNWTVTGGTITNGLNTDSITVTWDTSTVNGSINLIIINQYGCASPTGNIGITIVPLPNATATPDSATLCRNIPLQIFGSYNYGTIAWTTSGSGTFSDSTIASPTYIPGPTDSGFVNLTMVLSTLTCGNDTVHVVLNAVPAPNTVITISPSDTICFGDTATIIASGGNSIFWMNNGAINDSIFVTATTDSVFTVIVNNSYNCPDTDSVTIHVIPPGIPNAGSDVSSCMEDSVLLSGSVANAGSLIWRTLGDGTFSDTVQLNTYYFPGVTDTTTGSVTIFTTATGACSNLTDSMLISFNHPPSVYAGPDTLLSEGNGSGVSVPLSAATAYASSVHFTTSGSGYFDPNDSDLTASYVPSANDYDMDSIVITATVNGPCGTATDYFIIEFTPFSIPNVFTPFPSSPGYNDFFEIKNIPPGTLLKIWDRWGLMVYSSEDYQNDWDAHGLQADVYYYVLETRQKNFHGWIRVIRDEK
jgi:hypothetical protein